MDVCWNVKWQKYINGAKQSVRIMRNGLWVRRWAILQCIPCYMFSASKWGRVSDLVSFKPMNVLTGSVHQILARLPLTSAALPGPRFLSQCTLKKPAILGLWKMKDWPWNRFLLMLIIYSPIWISQFRKCYFPSCAVFIYNYGSGSQHNVDRRENSAAVP